MRYIKVFLLVLIFFIVMMFFVQNQTSFAEPVTLKLDLLVLPPMESVPLPLYAVMLICFTLGALLVLCMLMWDRVRLGSSAMNSNRKSKGLEKKLAKAEEDLANLSAKSTENEEKIKALMESETKLKAELEEAQKRLESQPVEVASEE